MDFQHISEWFRNFNDELRDIRIPGVLINDENKFIEENIEAKKKEIISLQIDVDENVDRIQMLENHQKIVQDELDVIQRLLAACRTEETTEQSHVNINTAELKRIERLIVVLENDLKRFTKRKNNFQVEIDQLYIQIEKINNSTQIEKDTSEKLINIMKKRDEESFCVMKYTRQDDIRIKELTIELERFSVKSIQLKRANEEEIIEYSGFQLELDKIAETFRRSHTQRQQLIKRWETILEQMQRKDYDIDRLSNEFIQIKTKLRTKEQELNEQKIFYEYEQNNNILTEKLINLTNQKIITLNEKQKIHNDKQEQVESDIFSLKFALVNTQNQLHRERALINELKTNIITKQKNLTELKQHHERIVNRKCFVLNEKYSINEKLSKFDKLMENEQKYQNNLNNQYKNLTEHFLSLNNELLLIQKREKQYEIDNQLYRNQIHNIQNQINKFDQQLLKQQELIYHHEFLKQTIDRRLNRILSEKNTEKVSKSDLKIRELKNEYEKKKFQYDQLQNQIKILNEELRIIKRDLKQLIDEKNDFNNKLVQFDLYTTLSEKMIKKLNIEKEDFLVEQNFINIELKRLKNILHNSSETNLTLEQQQIEIQKAIKERRMEVQANSHLFRIRFNDERTKKVTISTELAMRITKIDKLKHRYETFAVILNTDKSDEDNILEQAQYVIKSAQMKEDLLKQGDQLEALIMKGETELRALENTVEILKWNNIDVKKNFEKLNQTSPEICLMKELEEHFRAVSEQVKIRRKLLKDFTENQNSISQTELTMFEEEIEQTKIIIANKQRIQTKLVGEIEQYYIKINRADQLIKRIQQTIREQRNFEDIEQTELDIDIRLQRETNKKLEQQLVSLCLTIGDETLIDTLEQLSGDQGFNITINPSLIQSKKHQEKFEKKSPSSNMSLIPNIVNISIDSNSRSSTSESTRSKKSI